MSKLPTSSSTSTDIDAFIASVKSRSRANAARLVFALDATASREPTWDRACAQHAELFNVTRDLGGLDVQLCFYRGFREFQATKWHQRPDSLLNAMTRVRCAAGLTQIERVLEHCVDVARKERLGALIFIGDAFEEELDRVADVAGRLGLLGCPMFVFHEGRDVIARGAFQHLAKLTNGACCALDSSSPELLRDLLAAVAAYVAGGRGALNRLVGERPNVKRLTRQLR